MNSKIADLLPKVQLLEDFSVDSEKHLEQVVDNLKELEDEQEEEKLKTVMNMMMGMNTANRLGQVEVNSTPGRFPLTSKYLYSLVF